MILKYEIKFLDYWHLGSGLSAGTKLDSSVVKDSNTLLPYIPGKTIKGLAKEMAELFENTELIRRCFGNEKVDMGKCYFSNATLDLATQKEIIQNNLQEYLYDELASTKIGSKKEKKETEGIAVDNSLREIEVVIPITLYGEVQNLPEEFEKEIKKSFMMIKRMGLGRNRGLGRCEIRVERVS